MLFALLMQNKCVQLFLMCDVVDLIMHLICFICVCRLIFRFSLFCRKMSMFVCKEMTSELSRSLLDMASGGIGVDVFLQSSDSKIFPCHSFVLRNASTVLRQMLDDSTAWRFAIQYRSDVLRYVIQLIYVGQVVYPASLEEEVGDLLKTLGVNVRRGLQILGSHENLLDTNFLLYVSGPSTDACKH